MSEAFDQIVSELTRISKQEKSALRDLLEQELAASSTNGNASPKVPAFGWAKGRVAISADFDAPIDDFQEYVD